MKINQAESSCPYQRNDICAASLWSLRTDDCKKSKYCNSDNHDDCVLFLSQCLRMMYSGDHESQKVSFAHI